MMMGQLMELLPRCRGRSDGWYWIVRDDVGDEGHDIKVGLEPPVVLHHVERPHPGRLPRGDAVGLC